MSTLLRNIIVIILLALTLTVGCGEQSPPPQPKAPVTQPASAGTAPLPGPAPTADLSTVVFLGDSLTAGLGLGEEEAFPHLVGQLLAEQGLPVRVVNAGVSGDTSAGGLRRVDWVLKQKPAVIVVGLGGNDGLRGLAPDATEQNLRALIQRIEAGGAKVLLLGMQIPPNYGADYGATFAAVYPQLAKETGAPLVPFMLEGVGGHPELNQADGLHPNAEGQRLVARTVFPHLRDLLATLPNKAADPR